MTTNRAIQHKNSMKVPEPTLRRLPWYLSNVKLLKRKENVLFLLRKYPKKSISMHLR